MEKPPLDQTEYWNGEVGQRWAANQAAIDAMFAPLTEALLDQAALRPGARVLDIGCGAGDLALQAARRIGPEGWVSALDLSAPLLAVARDRAARAPAGGAPIDWLLADAQSHDLGVAPFDAALSRFGVMFFTDSVAALAHIRRALGPGGALTFLCWRAMEENPWVTLPFEAVAEMVPDLTPQDPDSPGPFRFAEREKLVAILERAGFETIACAPLDRAILLGRDAGGSDAAAEAAARFATEMGPVARVLRERDPALLAPAHAAVTRALAAHARQGEVRLEAACWLVTAR